VITIRLFSINETADIIGTNRTYVSYLVKKGMLKAQGEGKNKMIYEGDIENYIMNYRRKHKVKEEH
jgi:hypothetical protein